MSKLFTTDPKEISHLLSSINNKERALPDFQRDFIWDVWAVQELIHSVLRNFPAGSLLEIQQSENLFKPREFAGAPEISENFVPPYLILDGQQRLTSLYQALYGVGRHRFYINIGILMDQVKKIDDKNPLFQTLDLEESLFHETLKMKKGKIVEEDNWPIERQAEKLVFPISKIITIGGYEEWRDEIIEIRKLKGIYQDGEKEVLRRIGKELINNLSNYNFPVVTLQSNIPTEAVCTIFETLNRTGVKLSVFDLLVARFYPSDIKLRNAWEEAREDFPIFKEFEIDPYYLLQIIALRCERKGMGECKRGTVLKLEADDYRKYWDSTVKASGEALKILRDNCGVLTSNWLPYATFLIPFTAVISETQQDFHGPTIAGWKSKLQRWFWASTFAQLYENAPNSVSKVHYSEVKKWLKDDNEPEFIKTAQRELGVLELREITPRQRARYGGFMCLLLRRGIRDFYKAEPITANKIISGEVNDHHIFAKSVFGKGEWANVIDSIPNRTLIDEISNKIIKASRPSLYIPILEKEFQRHELKELFTQHLVPVGDDSPIWKDDIEKFFCIRSDALLNEAKGLIGGNGT